MFQTEYDEVPDQLCYEVEEIPLAHKEHISPRSQEHISTHIFLMIVFP